ncbi:unnamed protein product [Moneuplotes crassus]|uniref:Uncharacterized protein n=1 Tax=Euplotes crassus TaxID=5936 RepID=A0AAD1UCE4_EUPCR|nr:unnamed protein product [Moneuplotes crassus]
MDRSGSTSKSYPTEPNTSSEEEIQEFAYDDTESNNQSKKFQKITNILKEFRVESISEMLYREKSRQKSNSNFKSIIYNQKSESNSNEAREYTSSIPEQISNDDGLICEIDNKENLVIELEESEEDSQLNDSNIPAPVLRKGSQNQVVIDLKSLSQSKSRYKYQQADKEFRNCYKHSKIGDFARTDRKRISLNMDDFLTKPAEKSMKDASPELEINISKHQSLKIEDYLDDEPWNTNEDKKHPNIKEDLEKLDLDCFSSRSKNPNYIQKERDIESLSSIGKNKDSSIIDLCSQERHKYTPTLDTNCQSSSTRRNPTWFQTDCSNKADEDFTFKTKLDFDKTEDISPKLYYEYESRAKNHPFLISDGSDRSGLGFSDDEYKCDWAEREEITVQTYDSVQ